MHIYNGEVMNDEDVFVDITLPCLPPEGSYIDLGDEATKELEKKAKSRGDIGINYWPQEFPFENYGAKGITDFREEYLHDLYFERYHYVWNITFLANADYVSIELGDSPK